jgi:hypothetical protein
MRDRRDSDRIDRATARPPGAAAGEGERRGRREIRDYSTYFKGEITVLLYGPWAHATATEPRPTSVHDATARTRHTREAPITRTRHNSQHRSIIAATASARECNLFCFIYTTAHSRTVSPGRCHILLSPTRAERCSSSLVADLSVGRDRVGSGQYTGRVGS